MKVKDELTLEEAIKILPDGDNVHTFRNSSGMLFGVDWSREKIITALKEAENIMITGDLAQSMKHGIAIICEGSLLFIATREGI